MKQLTSGSMQARLWRTIPALAAVSLGATVASATGMDPDPPVELTYAKDVAPIIQENCQVCHQPGAIGPMSLMSYDEVRPWARVIKLRVEEQEMPPYHYDTDVGIQQLKHDGRLSAEEIATISQWVDQGAPLGNPADMPPPKVFPDAAEWRLADELGQPDLVIASTPYDVPALGQDSWWQPDIPTGLTKDRCIRAVETKPGVASRSVAHHANSSFRIPSGDSTISGGRLSEYALGKLGEVVPADACRVAPAGSVVSWDIHYYPNGEDVVASQIEVGLWLYPEDFDKDSLYRQTLSSYNLQGGDFDIPPHGTLMTQGIHSFDTPVRIDSFQPHGHLRLVGKRLEVFYPETGRKELISQVSNWNPGWHLSHMYEDDVAPLLPKGAMMIITAWYDNTADNPHNPDPEQWVGTGDRTTDEMSHAWIAVTHLDQAGYDRLKAEREAKGIQPTPQPPLTRGN
jgi:mono/diheme cytochrome c family protein